MFDPAEWDASHSNPRVTRLVAIDPVLTWRLTSAHVAGLAAKTLLIQLGAGPDRLPATDIGPEGSGFTARLPTARVLEIAPSAHVSALPLCTAAGAALLEEDRDDPVCTDPAGADRAQIHAQVRAAAVRFLGLN